MQILETKRMFLRLMMESDIDNLLKIFSDSEAMRYYPSTKNREQNLSCIQWTNENYKKCGIGL